MAEKHTDCGAAGDNASSKGSSSSHEDQPADGDGQAGDGSHVSCHMQDIGSAGGKGMVPTDEPNGQNMKCDISSSGSSGPTSDENRTVDGDGQAVDRPDDTNHGEPEIGSAGGDTAAPTEGSPLSVETPDVDQQVNSSGNPNLVDTPKTEGQNMEVTDGGSAGSKTMLTSSSREGERTAGDGQNNNGCDDANHGGTAINEDPKVEGDIPDFGSVPEHESPPQNGSKEESKPLQRKASSYGREADHQEEEIENIGPITQDTTESTAAKTTSSPIGTLISVSAVLTVIVACVLSYSLMHKPSPQKRSVDVIFSDQMEKVKTEFPNQRDEVWKRSRIHLQRHLVTAQPTEPVSLILTADFRAERTLHCLALRMASAFSSALNASVLYINGTSKASQDSDQVKLDIDSELQGAFAGGVPVAVIHRFEELPPGSTLIFYRYCDHENAAFKKTFLIFTVLLGEEEEIPVKISLNAVEEMVDDHLQKKFLSHDRPVSFDRMDLDKYSGLWSRISHLILPVAAERRIEREGCQGT